MARKARQQMVLTRTALMQRGRCWSSDTYNPCPGVMENVPAARGYTGGFGCDLMAKVAPRNDSRARARTRARTLYHARRPPAVRSTAASLDRLVCVEHDEGFS
jgi:hypothetical protein